MNLAINAKPRTLTANIAISIVFLLHFSPTRVASQPISEEACFRHANDTFFHASLPRLRVDACGSVVPVENSSAADESNAQCNVFSMHLAEFLGATRPLRGEWRTATANLRRFTGTFPWNGAALVVVVEHTSGTRHQYAALGTASYSGSPRTPLKQLLTSAVGHSTSWIQVVIVDGEPRLHFNEASYAASSDTNLAQAILELRVAIEAGFVTLEGPGSEPEPAEAHMREDGTIVFPQTLSNTWTAERYGHIEGAHASLNETKSSIERTRLCVADSYLGESSCGTTPLSGARTCVSLGGIATFADPPSGHVTLRSGTTVVRPGVRTREDDEEREVVTALATWAESTPFIFAVEGDEAVVVAEDDSGRERASPYICTSTDCEIADSSYRFLRGGLHEVRLGRLDDDAPSEDAATVVRVWVLRAERDWVPHGVDAQRRFVPEERRMVDDGRLAFALRRGRGRPTFDLAIATPAGRMAGLVGSVPREEERARRQVPMVDASDPSTPIERNEPFIAFTFSEDCPMVAVRDATSTTQIGFWPPSVGTDSHVFAHLLVADDDAEPARCLARVELIVTDARTIVHNWPLRVVVGQNPLFSWSPGARRQLRLSSDVVAIRVSPLRTVGVEGAVTGMISLELGNEAMGIGLGWALRARIGTHRLPTFLALGIEQALWGSGSQSTRNVRPIVGVDFGALLSRRTGW